ncbi:hypothetical protein LXA43DRAFT_1151891 [Ganoderma leucocontextum]|nr:hypothetical protein LXA43DRAFT_1151891 [Ganoderma leucocontextum]
MRVRYNVHGKRPMYVSRASNPHNWTLESSDADTDIDEESDSDSDSGSDQLPHPPPGQQCIRHRGIEVVARHARAMHTDPLRRHELHLIEEDSAELRLHLLEEEVLKVERVRSPAPGPIPVPVPVLVLALVLRPVVCLRVRSLCAVSPNEEPGQRARARQSGSVETHSQRTPDNSPISLMPNPDNFWILEGSMHDFYPDI